MKVIHFECIGISGFYNFIMDPIVCSSKDDLVLMVDEGAELITVTLKRKDGLAIWQGSAKNSGSWCGKPELLWNDVARNAFPQEDEND